MLGLTAVRAFIETAPNLSSDAHEAAASTARKSDVHKTSTGASGTIQMPPPPLLVTEGAGEVRRHPALFDVVSGIFWVVPNEVVFACFRDSFSAYCLHFPKTEKRLGRLAAPNHFILVKTVF